MRRWLGALSIALLAAARTSAHDLERTTVHLQVASDGAFTLRLAHDPAWLLLRMETFAGGPSLGNGDAAARDTRLQALAPQVIDRVVLWVDGREIRPVSAEYTSPPARVTEGEFALAAYTLRGRLPASSRTLRWYYGLVADPYPLTVQLSDGSSNTEWVLGDAWSTAIPIDRPFPRPPLLTRLREYLVVGYTHVLPNGTDHILFVIALFLLAGGRRLLAQVVTFTGGHMAGVGAVLLGLGAPPSQVVAPLTAVFIVCVAIENLRARPSIAMRIALVFACGLLHALGFVAALESLRLSRGDLALAMVGFNTGVELAQISAIAGAALLVGWWRKRPWYQARVVVPASLVIAAGGLYLLLRDLVLRGVRL